MYLTGRRGVIFLIEVRHLKKSYGNKEALKGIDFRVEAGEVFGLLGPNGAGKTTTIKILTGQIQPSSGEARVLGKDAMKQKEEIKLHMGIVPEKANLYERLTVRQNLELFCRLYGCDLGQVDSYLEKVHLMNEKNSPVKKLSKGMKQRVLLIRSMLHQPKLLFLDEPTSGLDPASAEQIHKLLLELNQKGMTILLTSHNMEEVEKLCDRVAFLDEGTIKAMGTIEELKLKYASRKMRVWIEGENGIEEKLMDMDGRESAACMEEWIRQGKLRSIHSCEPTLADIFVKITGREIV